MNTTPLGAQLLRLLGVFMLTFFFYGTALAQLPSMQELENVASRIIQGDQSGVPGILNRIDKNRLDLMSDSIQFYYYYLSLADNSLGQEEKIAYAEKAIALCENSVGVLDVKFYYLAYALSTLYQEAGRDLDASIAVLQKAYTYGISNLLHPSLNQFKQAFFMGAYSLCLETLAMAYQQKGWATLASYLYAFEYMRFTSMMFNVNQPSHYLPLEKAFECLEGQASVIPSTLDIASGISQYLIKNNATATRPYAIVMMYQGKARMDLGHYVTAAQDLAQSISIIQGINYFDEYLVKLYSWHCMSLAAAGNKKQLSSVMADAEKYYNDTGQFQAFTQLKRDIESRYPDMLK